MVRRRLLSGALALLLPLLGCSKTEDVAPEKKIFGEPPVIETVDFRFDPQFHFTCDFTEIMVTKLCNEYGTGDFQAPLGVQIEGTYTRLFITARVTDPNTTHDTDGNIVRNDILLVSASYVEVDPGTSAAKQEITLVMFDDGSETEFPRGQRKEGIGEECTIDSDGRCFCQSRIYPLTSNDVTRNDSLFTRGFGFVSQGSNVFLQDCIMKEQKQAYNFSPADKSYQFRFDVVDRSGNLTTWGDRPIATTGEDSFGCVGDACGCCLLSSSFPCPLAPDGCRGLEGMVSPSSFPDGLCKDHCAMCGFGPNFEECT